MSDESATVVDTGQAKPSTGDTPAPVVTDTTTVVTETKTDDATKAPADKVEDAPIEYVFDNIPEGMEVDTALLTSFTDFAKAEKLPLDVAKRVVDVYAKHQQAAKAEHVKTVANWVETVKSDVDMGGQQFDANMAVARSAIKAFGSPELVKLLDETGIGSHPAFVRLAYTIGKSIGEDGTIVRGDPVPMTTQERADKMYPTTAGRK